MPFYSHAVARRKREFTFHCKYEFSTLHTHCSSFARLLPRKAHKRGFPDLGNLGRQRGKMESRDVSRGKRGREGRTERKRGGGRSDGRRMGKKEEETKMDIRVAEVEKH